MPCTARSQLFLIAILPLVIQPVLLLSLLRDYDAILPERDCAYTGPRSPRDLHTHALLLSVTTRRGQELDVYVVQQVFEYLNCGVFVMVSVLRGIAVDITSSPVTIQVINIIKNKKESEAACAA